MAAKIIALPKQCPLQLVRMGNPPAVGVLRSEFTFNEYSRKLGGITHLLWKGVVPMEMLDKVVAALEPRPCETWDLVFTDFPRVHRHPDSGNRRMFALQLLYADVEGWGVIYHRCEALMLLAYPSWVVEQHMEWEPQGVPSGHNGCQGACIASLSSQHDEGS